MLWVLRFLLIPVQLLRDPTSPLPTFDKSTTCPRKYGSDHRKLRSQKAQKRRKSSHNRRKTGTIAPLLECGSVAYAFGQRVDSNEADHYTCKTIHQCFSSFGVRKRSLRFLGSESTPTKQTNAHAETIHQCFSSFGVRKRSLRFGQRVHFNETDQCTCRNHSPVLFQVLECGSVAYAFGQRVHNNEPDQNTCRNHSPVLFNAAVISGFKS